MKGLTEKQRQIIDFIEDFIERKSMPPTIYEIAEYFGIKAPTVSIHIKVLTQKGFLERSKQARTIRVSDKYSKFRRRQKPVPKIIPLLTDLSNIDAIRSGELASEQCLALDKSLFASLADEFIFAMKMPDSGLSADGINAGDIIFFKYETKIFNGNIAAIFARGKTFIRKYNLTSDSNIVELSEAGDKPRSATFHKKEIQPYGIPFCILRKI